MAKPSKAEEQEEGEARRPARRGAHPGDVQQHDHHHRRPRGQRGRLVVGRRASVSRARARARRSRRRSPARTPASAARDVGMRTVDVEVKGPGGGRESADPGAAVGRARGQVDQGRDADSAQRLPAAQAAARLVTRRQRPTQHTRSRDVARYTGPVCRLCRREGMKLFLKGDRCFKEKCAIERRGYPPGQHGQRRARRKSGLRHPAAREAEGQAHLRRAREAVPQLLQGGRAAQGHHRREPAASCSSGGSTTWSTASASRRRGRRRASSCATVTSRSTAARRPSRRIRCGRARRISVREKSRKNEFIRASVETARGRGIPGWLELDAEQLRRQGAGAADA